MMIKNIILLMAFLFLVSCFETMAQKRIKIKGKMMNLTKEIEDSYYDLKAYKRIKVKVKMESLMEEIEDSYTESKEISLMRNQISSLEEKLTPSSGRSLRSMMERIALLGNLSGEELELDKWYEVDNNFEIVQNFEEGSLLLPKQSMKSSIVHNIRISENAIFVLNHEGREAATTKFMSVQYIGRYTYPLSSGGSNTVPKFRMKSQKKIEEIKEKLSSKTVEEMKEYKQAHPKYVEYIELENELKKSSLKTTVKEMKEYKQAHPKYVEYIELENELKKSSLKTTVKEMKEYKQAHPQYIEYVEMENKLNRLSSKTVKELKNEFEKLN